MTNTRLSLEIAAVTHRGCVRARNDDTVAVNTWRCSDTMPTPLSTRLPMDRPHVMLVCDGMGGQPGGSVASLAAVESLAESIPLCKEEVEVANRIEETSVMLNSVATKDAALQWMGTTVAGLLITPSKCIWFNVGDSSVYRFRNYLIKLSHDDSPSGQRTGAVLQALGGTSQVLAIDPHVGPDRIASGISYLICSDGLTDAVSIDEIEAEMHGKAHDIVDRLLNLSLTADAHDNVSIIVVHVISEGEDFSND